MSTNGNLPISVKPLGQSGFRFSFGGTVVYVDPYLSNYVEEIEGKDFSRLIDLWIHPQEVCDADWVLITHTHIDHCDPKTVVPIAQASPNCRFLGPSDVCKELRRFGINRSIIDVAKEDGINIATGLNVYAIPAAHPQIERSRTGNLRCIGYLFDYGGRLIYHSGDTSVDKEIIDVLRKWGDIEIAFISVNEKNYYRDAQGIIGNMSVRDAFGLAENIKSQILVPMHWDMFSPNSVFIEEIELLYEKLSPNFELLVNPSSI